MGLIVIIFLVLGFAFGFMMFMLFSPVMFQVAYETGLWDDKPASLLAFRDQMYGLWFLIIPILAAIILYASWNQANINRATSA